MSSRFLCSRHGFKAYVRASQAIGDRIKARGEFARGELTKVSLERIKRSYQVWASLSEIAVCAASAVAIDGVVHLNAPREIAAFESHIVYVCPACLNELLVRSGEEPDAPTSLEQAYDRSLIAEEVQVSENILRCRFHGLVFPTLSSHLISSAIERSETLNTAKLVRILVSSGTREIEYWFDPAFVSQVLDIDIDPTAKTYRLDDTEAADALLDRGERVCHECLTDLLQRSGIG